MPTIALSENAAALLRENLTGPVPVTPGNAAAYRELEAAGIMDPLHTPRGRNSAYRFTESGWAAYGSRRADASVEA